MNFKKKKKFFPFDNCPLERNNNSSPLPLAPKVKNYEMIQLIVLKDKTFSSYFFFVWKWFQVVWQITRIVQMVTQTWHTEFHSSSVTSKWSSIWWWWWTYWDNRFLSLQMFGLCTYFPLIVHYKKSKSAFLFVGL